MEPANVNYLLTALAADTWHTPAQAAARLARAGCPEPDALLVVGLADRMLETEPGTGAVAYSERCWLPGRLLAGAEPNNAQQAPARIGLSDFVRSAAELAPVAEGENHLEVGFAGEQPGSKVPADLSSAPAAPAPVRLTYFTGGIGNTTAPRAHITPGQLAAVVRYPPPRLRALADAARAAYATHGKGAEYDRLKRRLDYVTPAGTFIRRADAGLLTLSGLLVLDFDGLPDPAAALPALLADPVLGTEVVLGFLSPSGAGLKVLLDVGTTQPLPDVLIEVSAYLSAAHGLTPDPSGKDVSRACFLSYDPAAWLRPACAALHPR